MALRGGPTEQCRSEGTPSLGEVPSGGAERFWLLLALSVRVNVPVASRQLQLPMAALTSGRSGFK